MQIPKPAPDPANVEITPAKPTHGFEVVTSFVQQTSMQKIRTARVLTARIGLIFSTLRAISNLKLLDTTGETSMFV